MTAAIEMRMCSISLNICSAVRADHRARSVPGVRQPIGAPAGTSALSCCCAIQVSPNSPSGILLHPSTVMKLAVAVAPRSLRSSPLANLKLTPFPLTSQPTDDWLAVVDFLQPPKAEALRYLDGDGSFENLGFAEHLELLSMNTSKHQHVAWRCLHGNWHVWHEFLEWCCADHQNKQALIVS